MSYDDMGGGEPPPPLTAMRPRRELTGDPLLDGLFANTGHRHYFLRVREIEHQGPNDEIITEYAYKCSCGERVDP